MDASLREAGHLVVHIICPLSWLFWSQLERVYTSVCTSLPFTATNGKVFLFYWDSSFEKPKAYFNLSSSLLKLSFYYLSNNHKCIKTNPQGVANRWVYTLLKPNAELTRGAGNQFFYCEDIKRRWSREKQVWIVWSKAVVEGRWITCRHRWWRGLAGTESG